LLVTVINKLLYLSFLNQQRYRPNQFVICFLCNLIFHKETASYKIRVIQTDVKRDVARQIIINTLHHDISFLSAMYYSGVNFKSCVSQSFVMPDSIALPEVNKNELKCVNYCK